MQFPNFETHSEELKLKNKESSKKAVAASILVMKKQAEARLEKNVQNFLLLDKRCKECNSLLEYKKDYTAEFCNHSCAASYTNKKRIVVYSDEAKENHRKIGFRNQANLLKRPKAQLYINVCNVCKNDFQVAAARKSKKSCSKECEHILRTTSSIRENNTYGKYGYYQDIYCASSWELAFLVFNKDLGKDIKRCDLTFTYFMDGVQHTYFPDFIMDNIIYEVKGLEKEDVKLKTEAVIAAGYRIEVIRRKEILPIVKALKEKYSVKDITELYDKKEVKI